MFNKDFYPTPKSVLDIMLAGLNFENKVILEPSAGKGDIIDYLYQLSAKEVLCCETHPELAKIAASKGRFITSDFFNVKKEDISHIHYIVMNPPFSADERHVLKAWEVAPDGCIIIALINYNTYDKTTSWQRSKLAHLVHESGTIENLGNVFSNAERETDVNIGLVRLYKPKAQDEFEFEGYFSMTEEEEAQENGIMGYNEIRNIVNRYVEGVKMFNDVMSANIRISHMINPISGTLNIEFGATGTRDNKHVVITRDVFKKELQKSAWKTVFSKLNMTKYLTQSVISDINKFVETQVHVPFTMENIHKMIEMVVGTSKGRLERVLVEAFEKICSYSDTNSEAKEQWKTNSNYKVNRKFIHPYICKWDSRWPKEKMDIDYSASDRLDDLIKAMCILTGEKYEDQIPLRNFFEYPYHFRRVSDGKLMGGYKHTARDYNEAVKHQEYLEREGIKTTIEKTGNSWGTWYDWGFFRVKGFKKGTMHFEFLDEKVWDKFNMEVARIKGWRLPTKTDTKQKGTERVKETDLVLF